MGIDRHDVFHAEQELDREIRRIGTLAVHAENNGDRTRRNHFLTRMFQLIRSRTPEHQARLLRENDERVDQGDFTGKWTEALCTEIRGGPGAHFDVSARAVRRRMGGQLG